MYTTLKDFIMGSIAACAPLSDAQVFRILRDATWTLSKTCKLLKKFDQNFIRTKFSEGLNVQILCVLGILFNKFAARLDLVAHEK